MSPTWTSRISAALLEIAASLPTLATNYRRENCPRRVTYTLIWKSSKHLTFKLSTWSERCLTALLTINQHVVLSHGPRTLCPAYGTEEKDPAEHLHLLGYHNTSFKCIKVEGGEEKKQTCLLSPPGVPPPGLPCTKQDGKETRQGTFSTHMAHHQHVCLKQKEWNICLATGEWFFKKAKCHPRRDLLNDWRM